MLKNEHNNKPAITHAVQIRAQKHDSSRQQLL